jgi:TPP-dependent pyruvate/acetoin dehydrogenase alpha subunit
MNLTTEELSQIYYRMLQARHFEEKIQELFKRGLMHGTTHLGIGAAFAALRSGDLTILTHRGHNETIGLGADMTMLMGEMLGKAGGCSGGKGGSMHFIDLEHGNYGETGVVGGTFPLACGMAFTQQYKDTGKAVLCVSGDGSVNTGNFHESVNLASVWKLPVVFLIENNLYAMSTPLEKEMNIINISDRAQAYGIPGITIDGNDVIEVYEIVKKALDYAREGEGPFLIEALTYRQCGHSKSDKQTYRSEMEVENWKKEDPIPRFAEYLIDHGLAEEDELYSLDRKAYEDVCRAFETAQEMSEPEDDAVYSDVYAE